MKIYSKKILFWDWRLFSFGGQFFYSSGVTFTVFVSDFVFFIYVAMKGIIKLAARVKVSRIMVRQPQSFRNTSLTWPGFRKRSNQYFLTKINFLKSTGENSENKHNTILKVTAGAQISVPLAFTCSNKYAADIQLFIELSIQWIFAAAIKPIPAPNRTLFIKSEST